MADWKEKFNLFKEKATVVKDKASVVAADLGKKGKEQYDIRKIKASIRSLNKASDKDLKEIGKMYYESHMKRTAVDDEKFLKLCKNIKNREDEIAELEADIEEIRSDDDFVDIDDVVDVDAVMDEVIDEIREENYDEVRNPEDYNE